MGVIVTPEVLKERNKLWEALQALDDPRTKHDIMDNIILDVDSYKLCHAAMFKEIGVTAGFAYTEPRIQDMEMMVIGRQIWLKNLKPITMLMIDEAEQFFKEHITDGELLFPRQDWEDVVNHFDGYMPLRIRGIPEGMIIPSGKALTTFEVNEEDFPNLAWMGGYAETSYLRSEWYPVTVATKSREIRKCILKYLAETSDIDPKIAAAFMFHDFGARGVSSKESAMIGGLAHLATGAMGSDTISGILGARKYYNCHMAAYSVFATEHSIMTLRGRTGELQTVRDLIKTYNKRKHTIVSIVSDGYNIYDLALHYCTTLKQEILDAEIKLVVRPDSGNAVEVILKLLSLFAMHYGYTVNSKGFKVLNVVRILQGDGLSKLKDFKLILDAVKDAGYSVENLVFGQGGGLLQQVNRDDYKFAMKTCAAKINGVWVDVFKDPITDVGKKSKAGRLTTVLLNTGKVATVDRENIPEGATDLMVDIWYRGLFFKEFDFDEIRESSNVEYDYS